MNLEDFVQNWEENEEIKEIKFDERKPPISFLKEA